MDSVQNGVYENPNYGSTGKLPKIAFEASASQSVTKDKLPPIVGSPEKPRIKQGITNGAYYTDGSVETVVAMENMPKQSYIGK